MGKWFRTRLKEARDRVGLSQAELAQRFHVSQGAVSAWENGFSEPRGELWDRVVDWIERVEKRQDDEPQPTARVEDEFNTDQVHSFGEWLLNERQSRGLSRAELAEKAGLSPQAVYAIEIGKVRNPWKKTRERLLSALGTNQLPIEIREEIRQESEVQGLGEFSDFSPWDDSMIPEEPCVYVYYDRTDRPIYVGQTNNLRRRNRQHQEQDKWFFRRLVERGGYLRVDDETRRAQLERVLIQFLGRNTLFNKQNARKDEV